MNMDRHIDLAPTVSRPPTAVRPSTSSLVSPIRRTAVAAMGESRLSQRSSSRQRTTPYEAPGASRQQMTPYEPPVATWRPSSTRQRLAQHGKGMMSTAPRSPVDVWSDRATVAEPPPRTLRQEADEVSAEAQRLRQEADRVSAEAQRLQEALKVALTKSSS